MRSQVGNLPAEHVGNIQNVYVSSPAAPFPNGRALNYGRASFAPSPVQSTLGSPGYEGMLSREYRNYDFPMQYTNGSPSQGSSSNQNPRESAMPPYYANYSPHVSSPGNYQPQANFSDGKGFMHSQLKETGSEIKGSPADTASMTLYGQNLGMTAYDLSAPAAPRAHSTGNPFA